jgi:hypothetical protein
MKKYSLLIFTIAFALMTAASVGLMTYTLLAAKQNERPVEKAAADIFNNGASDIYVVDRGLINGKKREAMIPNVPEFIKKVSLEEGVFIAPIEGMFE